MAPKKGQKMSLNAFLGDTALGSWADEMDSLPSAPAPKVEGEGNRDRRGGDRDFSRSDRDFPPRGDYPSRDRSFPQREELPLPTAPPYISFVGNLAFDLTEIDLEQFFSPIKVKSVKLIRDREEKPKGFGYVEFDTLDGLKDGLLKTGGQLANRSVRVSVAEPPKERAGGGFDDDKFAGNWRRDGPLPTPPSPRGHSRDLERGGSGFSSKFGGADRDRDGPKSAEAENNDDWRSNRPARTTSMAPPSPRLGNAGLAGPPMERAGSIRKTSGFVSTAGDGSHPADKEEVWSIGSKFKPSEVKEEKRSLFGGRRGDSLREPAVVTKLDEEGDWRSAPRKSPVGRPSQLDGTSPTTSTPPTPQLSRRKLELLPRSTSASQQTSPLSSPKSASNPSWSSARSNPFGAAKPVDAAAREKAVEEKLEREHSTWKERSVSGSSINKDKVNNKSPADSRSNSMSRPRTPPQTSSPLISTPSTPTSSGTGAGATKGTTANIRPKFSFTAAAAMTAIASIEENGEGGMIIGDGDEEEDEGNEKGVEKLSASVAEVTLSEDKTVAVQ